MMEHTATRFGSPWSPLRATVAVLRARATRYGYPLGIGVDDIDAAAAVVATDMWMAVLKATSLENPARYGTPAVRSLAAAIARAAGFPQRPEVLPHNAVSWPTDEILKTVDEYMIWVESLGLPREAVFLKAAGDLSHGSLDTRLLGAAQVLHDAA